MKVYFLISLHMLGAEQFCKALISEYKQDTSSSGKFGTKLDVYRHCVEIVVFGSNDSLNALDNRSIAKKTIEGSSENRFVVAKAIKSFIESSVFTQYSSSHEQKKVYVMTNLKDEDYWETPNDMRIKSYLTQLIFLYPHFASLHEWFGCGASCSVLCSLCRGTYQKCNPDSSKMHTMPVNSGRCLNNGCQVAIMRCQKGTSQDHAVAHIPVCHNCGWKTNMCDTTCRSCGTTHCVRGARCPVCAQKERVWIIADNFCPICSKRFTSRHGLEDHFQHCYSTRYVKPDWVISCCSCRVRFLDETHKMSHYKKNNRCVLSEPAPPKKKEFEDEYYYYVTTPPASPRSSPAVDGFGSELISTIYIAFEAENSPLYTLSAAETTHIKSVNAEIDAILRMSGIVSSVIGFGSADKKTGVPGFVDVDLLVSINNFDPAKRKEYATSFRALLQEAGANLKESAHDIQQLEYNGVEFDLVLIGTDARDNDKRAKDFAEARTNVTALRAVVGTNNYVLETIRAAKYWSKRSFPAGGIKSCLIEAVVLAHFAAQTTALAELATQKKRRVRLFELFLAYVAHPTPPVLSDTVTELSAAGPVTPKQRAAAKTALEALQRMG